MRHARGLKPGRWYVLMAALLALGFAVPAAQSSPPEPIVGGSPATPGEYPAQGYLVIESSSFCGGTLVGSRWFLTAAHCAVDDFGPLPPSSFFVGLGHVDRTQITDVYGVTAVDVNSAYNPATFQNDVAMLKLDRPAPYQFMRVIGSDEAAKWAAGIPARIVGWGATSSGGPASNVVLEADVPIVSDATCASQYALHVPQLDPSTMACAGDGVHDTCQGDSGGPLMVPDGAGFVLVGITSWGEGCADPDFSGVYTRLGAPALNSWALARFPRASFSFSPSSPVALHPATFTSTSFHPEGPSGFTTFNWDFDNDGAFDDRSGSTTAWPFPGPGTFQVSLEASTPGGDRAVSSGQVVVQPNAPPAASAGGPYRVAEGGVVVLVGTGSDPEGQPITFSWDLDGNGSFETTLLSPQFSAARIDGPASRSVNVRVCDVVGACSVDGEVIGVTNARPRANAGANRRTRAGRRLCFRGRASDPGAGDRLRVTWRFGNRRTGRGLRPCTSYRRAGRYTVRMTVRDDDGAAVTDTLVVRVARKRR